VITSNSLLRPTLAGLYCAAGDFTIDPRRSVERAVITHAHADHARRGSKSYLCSQSGAGLLRERVGGRAPIEGLNFGRRIKIGDALVSLHPAGHILGSAQVRIESRGEVWVVSGDYKTEPDPTCEPFEPVRCDTFITESTFALPIYRWPKPEIVFAEINRWWRRNSEAGVASVVYAYALGKAQRVLAGLDKAIGPIWIHQSVAKFIPHYLAAGFALKPGKVLDAETPSGLGKAGALVITPGSAWEGAMRRSPGLYSTAFASGWMLLSARRLGGGFDRGFVVSDHADWNGLVGAVKATGARNIGVTHGDGGAFVRWLNEHGYNAFKVPHRPRDGQGEFDFAG
jgi:putative mRNA 3-end processing factor